MAKKSFNTQGALAWVNQDILQEPENKPAVQETKKETAAAETVSEEITEPEEEQTEKKHAKAKTSKKSGTSAAKNSSSDAKFVLSPARELKSRRTSVLLKTSIYDKISELAKGSNTSFNDCLNQILEQVLPE